MIKKYLVRTIAVLFSVAFVGFVVLVVLGGGPKTVDLKRPAAITAKDAAELQNLNLTATAAGAIVKKIDLLTASTTESAPSREIVVQSALDQTLKAFDPESFFPPVTPESFIINNTADERMGRLYLLKLFTILNKTGGVIPADTTDSAQLDFEKSLAVYTSALSELYALPVPKQLIEIHREAITITAAHQEIFTALKNHKADPLKAFLAAESEDLVTTRSNAFYDDISVYLKNQKSSGS